MLGDGFASSPAKDGAFAGTGAGGSSSAWSITVYTRAMNTAASPVDRHHIFTRPIDDGMSWAFHVRQRIVKTPEANRDGT
ncbi:MAG: hypothetical protein HRF43_06810 [Phycisphaerae bacterium]